MTLAQPQVGTGAATPLLEFRNISKSFGAVKALRDVSFDLLPGEVHALLGQNGAGKSTLIKILAGVQAKDGGNIRVNGEESDFRTPAGARGAGIAVVYQELSLVPDMSVADNMFLSREPKRFGLADRARILREARAFLEGHGFPLDPKAVVRTLPFAYRQLTEIAKALLGDVRILVLDEPTSALSAGEEATLFNAVAEAAKRGVGVIYVTHRLGEVFRLAQRVTVLRDGRNVATFKASESDIPSLVSAIVGPGDQHGRLATVVGLGPHGEQPSSPNLVHLTEAEAGAARKAHFRIGIALHTGASDWSRQQLAGITKALHELGADLGPVEYAGFDAAKQIDQIVAMVKSRPDAIIAIPVDNTMMAEAFKSANAAGIKLVLMDNAPAGMRAGNDYSCVVSADNMGIGQIAAQLLASHIPANGTAAVIGFGRDFFVTVQREVAFKQWLADNRPDVTVIQTTFADPSAAGRVGADFLAAHPEVSGAFVVWDEPAMEIVKALRAQGKAVAMTTADLGSAAAMELARGGMIKGIAAQRPFDQGVAEAEAAIAALLGKPTPAWIAMPPVSVTQRNLIEAFETIWHTPPPEELVAAHAAANPPAAPSQAAPTPMSGEDRGPPVVELREASNDRLKGVTLTVQAGEILGLGGMIGSGRTEILETIFGLRRVRQGEYLLKGKPVTLNGPVDAIRKGIALVPEDRHLQGLVLDHSIERNLAMPRLARLTRAGMFLRGLAKSRADETMGDLSIKAPNTATPLKALSGGNQQKVVFGKWRNPTPDVLLLDEPTAGVDVGAREQIYALVRRAAGQGSAVIVVSSDLGELAMLCDRIAVVAGGTIKAAVSRADIRNEEQLHQLVQEMQG